MVIVYWEKLSGLTMEAIRRNRIFDCRSLRLLLGLVSLTLPFAVSLASSAPLNSISAAYYSEARPVFVGLLLAFGLLLLAYNGHSVRESRVSKVASVAAIIALLFPASCENCSSSIGSQIHFMSAAVLFSILAYFCLGPFQKDTRGETGKKARRSLIYRVCGWTMVACIAGLLVANLTLSVDTINSFRLTYYGEAVALVAFGVAGIVSGKMSRLIADEDELFKPFE